MSTAAKQIAITEPEAIARREGSFTFWTLCAFYAIGRVFQVYPGRVSMLGVVALHVFPPAIFAVIHGAKFYRWRGILTFVILCLLVGNISENVGVRTGFPFGRYYFTDLMGPKILVVPIMLGIAYVGMAYLSWTIARLILGLKMPLSGSRVVILPLVAAFIMVAWDLCLDPVWSTVLRAWIFPNGGPYFGVPISNFMGWYLTIYLIYQLFTLYLRSRATTSARLPLGYWRQAVGFYAVSAAGNLLLVLPQNVLAQNRFTLVTDPTGSQWKVSDITATCALVTVFTMGVFAVLAWMRLAGQKTEGDLL